MQKPTQEKAIYISQYTGEIPGLKGKEIWVTNPQPHRYSITIGGFLYARLLTRKEALHLATWH